MRFVVTCLITAVLILATQHMCSAECLPKVAQYARGEALVLLQMTEQEKNAAVESRDVFEKSVRSHAEEVAIEADSEVVNVMMELSASSGKIFAHFRSRLWTTELLIEKLKQNSDVISAEPNYINTLNNKTLKVQ